jgi:hypothetical protein
MSEPSKKELRKAIERHVAAAEGEPIGLKALTKALEAEFDVGKGGLKDRKELIKKYLMEAMEASSESESEEEEVIPRKGTRKGTVAGDDAGRARAGTETLANEDGEIDRTAGRSRAGQVPDHAGFLKKRGDQGRIKLWRKRHFRLYRKEGIIAYFKNETDDQQLGEISVSGAFLVDKRDDLGKNVFTVTMKTTARVWILQANDEATMNQWIDLCKPLMKETAAVRSVDGKKPHRPQRGLPLAFPPTYVQGFAEREGTVSSLQDGEHDWTKLSHVQVEPVALAAGQVAIAVHGSTAVVEEVREVEADAQGQAFVHDVPKQLKYHMETVGWTAGDSQLMQVRFLHDEKTQRDLLRKLVGRTLTASVPGTGAGHQEDAHKKQETRKEGDSHHYTHIHGAGGATLAFPGDSTFTGKLAYDEQDERYALVDEASNTVHFLNTKDARTIQVTDANVKKLNEGTEEALGSARLALHFAAGASKSLGQLSYQLQDSIDTHINYAVTLTADESKADVQGWYSFENKTSKTYEQAVVTVVPDPVAEAARVKKAEEKTLEDKVADAAEEEGKSQAKKKLGNLGALAAGLFSKDEEEVEEAPPKHHRYPVAQKVTLPAYDWAHAAFLSQQVAVTTEHLVRFDTPAYTIKPQCGPEAGTDAGALVYTVARFKNPLTQSVPGGRATVNRRQASGLGSVKVADVTVPRAEAGEEVVLNLEKTHGISATRRQTGFNFDGEKHFIIETFEITVVNTRNETVNVTVEESLFRWSSFEIPASKPEHTQTDHPRRIRWNLRLNHGEDQTIKYTCFSSNFELDSDYDCIDPTK